MQSAGELRSRAVDDRADGRASAHEEPEAAHAGGTLVGPGPQTVFSPPPFTMPFAAGEVLAGKYEVVSLIGVGGIAFVVAALHRGFENYVALKFLRPEFAQHPEAARRFIAEAKSNFRLRSEHIVRVLDVDRLPDGKPFMVMERLAGFELRALIADRGCLKPELAVDFALQICEALATAHAARVVHRDIKPENLFVTRHSDQPEQIKVLDFGICREMVTFDQPHQRIVTTQAVGSPPYMSPEQVRGAPDIDGRSDIWSLGCVLYEMLSGRALFHRPSAAEAFAAVLEAPVRPLRELRPELPSELEQVVARCLEKEAKNRFQSVAELADALVPFAPAHAYVSAARCAHILDERAECQSGIQAITRLSRASRAPTRLNEPRSRSRIGVWAHAHRAVLLPLSLVLSVPMVSGLAWLAVARDKPAYEPTRVTPPAAINAARPPIAQPSQQQVGPIEVAPLEIGETRSAADPRPSARVPSGAKKFAVRSAPNTATSGAPKRDIARQGVPAQLRPLVPKPDPYAGVPSSDSNATHP